MSRRLPLSDEMKKIWNGQPNLHRNSVYKYTTKSVATEIVDFGSVKIGGLQDFRKSESLKLRDENEGMNSVSTGHGSMLIRDAITNSVFGQAFELSDDAREGPYSPRMSGNLTIQVPFCFPTLCFTYSLSADVRKTICDDENGYEACVRITNLSRYCDAVAEFISTDELLDVRYLALPVIYRDKVRHVLEVSPSNLISAFEKPTFFEPNQECRVVFFVSPNSSGYYLFSFEQLFQRNRKKGAFRISDGGFNDMVLQIPKLREFVEIVSI